MTPEEKEKLRAIRVKMDMAAKVRLMLFDNILFRLRVVERRLKTRNPQLALEVVADLIRDLEAMVKPPA